MAAIITFFAARAAGDARGRANARERRRIINKSRNEETTMLNRRDLLLASVAAGVAMQNRAAFAKAAQPTTPVNFDVPAGACDCHTHIHGDPEKFPFFAGRVYTPEPASPEEMAALHKALHIERVVIVTPSVYGTDNSATLFGMKARGDDRARRRRDRRQDAGERSRRHGARPASAASGSILRPAASTIPASAARAFRPRSSA